MSRKGLAIALGECWYRRKPDAWNPRGWFSNPDPTSKLYVYWYDVGDTLTQVSVGLGEGEASVRVRCVRPRAAAEYILSREEEIRAKLLSIKRGRACRSQRLAEILVEAGFKAWY